MKEISFDDLPLIKMTCQSNSIVMAAVGVISVRSLVIVSVTFRILLFLMEKYYYHIQIFLLFPLLPRQEIQLKRVR